MRYIGIANSRKKQRLLARPYRIEFLNPVDVAWDCRRHLGFLDYYWYLWKNGNAPTDPVYHQDITRSKYHRYLYGTGHSVDSMAARCCEFARMYLSVIDHPKTTISWFPWATVTNDGLRLDGSHRAAIARHLGYPSIPVAVVEYRWWDWWWRWRMRRFREAALKGDQS